MYGSIFYFVENYNSSIQIQSCFFANNSAFYNLIDLNMAKVTISNTEIQNNTNNLFSLVSASLILNDNQITQQICLTRLRGCILEAEKTSNIEIQSTTFLNVISEIEEGNIYVDSSSIYLDSIRMENLKTPKKGSCISSFNSTLIVLKSNFSVYDFNCIDSFESNLTLNNSIFDNSERNETNVRYSEYGSVFCSSSKQLIIFNSSFIENSYIFDGSALYIVATQLDKLNEISITNSFFSGNSAFGKGTIYIYNQNFSISSSTFMNNVALRGGGIYCNNDGMFMVYLLF